MSEEIFNDLWLVICTTLVFFMQAGFTSLEAGLVREPYRGKIVLKNIIDFSLSGILFLFLGYGLMFGASWNGLLGSSNFFLIDNQKISFFLFQLVFCGTATTIASGAIAERVKLQSYLIIVFITSTLIYPIIGHWIWNMDFQEQAAGWLGKMGFRDFAGSTVVHSVGAWAALAACLIIKPREGRFDPSRAAEFKNYNLPLVSLGVFILWFGWIGFNGGSTFDFNEYSTLAIQNTFFSGMGGALLMLVYELLKKDKISPIQICNGYLAGLVAITANCIWVSVEASIMIGAVGALVSALGIQLLERYKVDDVVNAIPIHGFAGVWGTLAVALFSDKSIFVNGSRTEQFLIQLLGIVITFIWTFGIAYISLYLLNRTFNLFKHDKLDFIESDLYEDPLISKKENIQVDEEKKTLDEKIDLINYETNEKIGRINANFERTVLSTLLVSIIFIIAVFAFTYKNISDIFHARTIDQLRNQVETIKTVRKTYTEKVVSKVQPYIEVRHDYHNREKAIPLPATLTKELGVKLAQNTDITTKLYSDYRFPWRSSDPPLSKDRIEAIRFLRKDPSDKFITKILKPDGPYLRYSVADVMISSCINCHNTHPQSPKRDWKVGDVRGVLEVEIPMLKEQEVFWEELTVPVIFGIIFFVFAGIVLSIILSRFKHIAISWQKTFEKVKVQQEKIELQKGQIHQSEKLASIGELAAGVGHEINNPLTIAIGNLNQLETDLEKQSVGSDKINSSLSKQKNALDRIEKIVKNLRNYSRTASEVSAINIHKNIDNTVSLVLHSYLVNGVVIEKNYKAENYYVLGNGSKFQQVIMNLISNAKEAMADCSAKKIIIETNNINGNLEIKIKDSGKGIPAAVQSKVFKSFYTTKHKTGGTGLGLSISHAIIKEFNGELTFESIEKIGTTFKILLPNCEKISLKESNETSKELSVYKLTGKILIIDDEPDIIEIFVAICEELGLTPTAFSSAVEAISHLSDYPNTYDYIVTDMHMPEINGLEFLKTASTNQKEATKRFISTGGLEVELDLGRDKNINELVDGYIQKPFTLIQIFKKLSGLE